MINEQATMTTMQMPSTIQKVVALHSGEGSPLAINIATRMGSPAAVNLRSFFVVAFIVVVVLIVDKFCGCIG